MGKFNFEIPEKLHTAFKIMSIKEGKDMRVILVTLIKDYLNTSNSVGFSPNPEQGVDSGSDNKKED